MIWRKSITNSCTKIRRVYPLIWKIEELHTENPHNMYPDAKRLSYSNKIRFLNTLNFLNRFEDDTLVKWTDFGWRNPLHGDRKVSRRNKKSVGLGKVVGYDSDIFWLGGTIPNF